VLLNSMHISLRSLRKRVLLARISYCPFLMGSESESRFYTTSSVHVPNTIADTNILTRLFNTKNEELVIVDAK
jgi:hypothetical protein